MKRLIGLLALFALATNVALADPLADVMAASAKFLAVKSYRTTTVAPGGQVIKAERVSPDLYHVVAPGVEVTSIGDTTYMKMGASAWRKAPPAMSMRMDQASLEKMYGKIPPTAVVHDLGMKTVDGASLHAYFVQRSPADKPMTVYVNTAGLPARVEVADPRGTIVMTVYDFNAPISIVAPI